MIYFEGAIYYIVIPYILQNALLGVKIDCELN